MIELTDEFLKKIYILSMKSLTICFIIAIFILIVIFYQIKDCDVEYAEIIKWRFEEGHGNYGESNYGENEHKKLLEYIIDNKTIVKGLNQSGDLELIQSVYPKGNGYILTTCKGEIKGITRRGMINDVFFYKLAQLI